jgi:hypothetical protein
MANPEHLTILNQGVTAWNEWRKKHKRVAPALSGADLSKANLSRADLSDADLAKAALSGANLTVANLSRADLSGTNLSGADLTIANLSHANLNSANLAYAVLEEADLSSANLTDADLTVANLMGANLTHATLADAHVIGANLLGAHLDGADLSGAQFGWTIIADCDLRGATGLDAVEYHGPSFLSIDTIYRSEGEIPEAFLLGCGVPDSFIAQIPALIGALQPIQFYSCFISYSTKDEDFATRLHERMRAEKLRVWFAPEDVQGGKKLHEQIERAIQAHDRLLLVLSENSIDSEWVMTEIRNARKTEVRDNRRKLFPIRLCDYEALRDWRCFDGDIGKDLAVEVREYFMPDFSNWKNHDDFESAFAKLLRDLRASES